MYEMTPTAINQWLWVAAWTLYVETNLVSTENRDQLLTNQNSELQ